MKTIVYISRHSITQKINVLNDNENAFTQNIRTPISVLGEENAKKMSNYKDLKNIDIVFSSNYARAISTAKYVAFNNNLDINIDYRFGERVHGIINDYSELPSDFYERQLLDENYKLNNGESRIDVTNRMREALFDVIKCNEGKRIYITSHSTAMLFLFISFGKLEFVNNTFKLIVNDKLLIDSSNFKWNEHTPELFKLEFDGNNLNNIEFIEWFDN